MKRIAILHTVRSVYNSFSGQLKAAVSESVAVSEMVDEFLVTNAKEKGFFPPENRRKLYLDLLSLSEEKPDAIVVTCSSLTPFIAELRSSMDVPVIAIDDRMCADAVSGGERIAVFATAPTTVDPTVSKIQVEADKAGKKVEIVPFLDTKAMDLLSAGDTGGHDARLAALAEKEGRAFDTIVLAQASMATAKEAVERVSGRRTLTSPGSCIAEIREVLGI